MAPASFTTPPRPEPRSWPDPLKAQAQDLIRRAQRRATGADVHRVANLCATYRLFTALASGCDPHGEQAAKRDELELALEIYAHTGHCPGTALM